MIEYENLSKSNALFFDEYQKVFATVLRNGRFILADEVSSFESNFAKYCGVKYCCGVASGFDAIMLSLMAFGFNPGGEVIVPSNTYIATIFAIIRAGLVPVLVEPRLETYNLDPEKINVAITKRTVAVLVVHLYGKCSELERIQNICLENDLKLIEDAAQAHGAGIGEKKAGSFGSIAAFSFYPTKNLGALGDGGCITTDDERLYQRVRILRNYGSAEKYRNETVGINSRLDELQAAFLNIKLKRLDEINRHKRSLAELYFGSLTGFVLPVLQDGYYDVFHIFNIRHPERDRLRKYMLERGVGTELHYPVPPHRQPALRGYLPDEQHFAISDEIHRTTISLPIAYFHSEDDVVRVISILNEF